MSRYPSKPRGRCNQCGETRTLQSLASGHCKPCGYEWGNCNRCLAYRKIYVTGRCYGCYQDDLVRVRLNKIQSEFLHPASQYNQDLFGLYLTYVRRYRMSYDHVVPTQKLVKFLTQFPVSPIRSWNDVGTLSRRYPLTRSPGRLVHDNGCAWTKMGYMLQELGVLPPKSDEHQHRIQTLLEDMDSQTAEHVSRFVKQLKKSGRTDLTLTRYLPLLRSLVHWLSQLDPPETLLLANQMSLESYLECMGKTRSYSYVVTTFRRFAAFYRWAKREQLILLDPSKNIHLSRAAEKLSICSKTQFDQLGAFIRDPQTNVEHALAVTLILFFGLTNQDLAQATIDLDSDGKNFKIILARRPRSRGRRHYNREQILELPGEPPWFEALIQRFCSHWQACAARIQSKASYPRAPLFFDPQFQHNRNLGDNYITGLLKMATLQATGIPIPPRVLRQTCGHLMTRGGDASALSRLGWSPQFAFHYTWLPRVRFTPKAKA